MKRKLGHLMFLSGVCDLIYFKSFVYDVLCSLGVL
jgi:hypothetical protein